MRLEAIIADAADAMPPVLAAALAAELVRLSVDLADLAYDLGGDPETLRRHMGSLQAIDRITQTQLGIADVLRARGSVADRLDGVTLEDMADRLRRATDGG